MAKKNKQTDIPNTTGQYDRIFKENAEEIYASLIKALLKIDTSTTVPLSDSDLQHTIERKADFLRKVMPTHNLSAYALHIEIQSDNHPAMHKRMLLYHTLIFQTYNLDSEQFVIYIGNELLDMPTQILHKKMAFSYTIIDIRRYDYEEFLQASTPEEVILAILGNFHGEQPEDVIEKILLRLQEMTNSTLALGKYTTQLNIISKLRKLQNTTLNKIKSMPIIFDYTETLAYQEGEAKGEAKGKAEGEAKTLAKNVEQLLRNKKLSPQEIADVLGVTLDYVQNIQQNIV
jgi:predicted transposase/invertase (TIGR01784 family)